MLELDARTMKPPPPPPPAVEPAADPSSASAATVPAMVIVPAPPRSTPFPYPTLFRSLVYTRDAAPHDWAATQNNLANAFNDRLAGEREKNIDAAIQHDQNALLVYT
ncbi:MAG: hypothetical protein KDC38_13300, partial [Planctomycetes bacterium]|nr:hypothetical protein [Planctomycetota bacterium]